MLLLKYLALPKIKGSFACIFQSNPRMCCDELHEKNLCKIQSREKIQSHSSKEINTYNLCINVYLLHSI